MGKRIQKPRMRAEFKSALASGTDRFLSDGIEYVLTHGLRTPGEFVAYFPPMAIARALSNAPRLRAQILEVTAGLSLEAAQACSAGEAGALLDQAFDEGDASPEVLLCLLNPDARVRYLNRFDLWAFLADHTAWARGLDPARREPKVAAGITYLFTRAMEEALIAPGRIATILGAERMLDRLPRPVVSRIIERSIERGRRGKVLGDAELEPLLSCSTLLKSFEPVLLLEEVLVPELTALFHGPTRPCEAGAVAASIDSISVGPIMVDAWAQRDRTAVDRHPFLQ